MRERELTTLQDAILQYLAHNGGMIRLHDYGFLTFLVFQTGKKISPYSPVFLRAVNSAVNRLEKSGKIIVEYRGLNTYLILSG